jgi:alkylhydroperoxidase/carboxymuconolactone decarboxylase family protein YurZ|tara:strand:+ start:529 stop:903 length:375 start_codon:yes stop_codon:yes gene_type:complete
MKNDKIKTKDTIKTQSIGRPKKELDKDVIAKLSQIGCTQEEIGSVVGISARTLQRRYADLVAENKNIGKASLRKKLWEKALKGNDKLLIWLSKQELNMRDKIETQNIVEPLPLIIDAKADEVNG